MPLLSTCAQTGYFYATDGTPLNFCLHSKNTAILFFQILATFCATLGCYLNGTVLGYSAPAIPTLMNKNGTDLYGNSFYISSQQASWITGILSLGCFFGCILAGPIMEKVGRKKTLLYFTSLWFFLGYLLIFLANHIALIYMGRYV